MQVVALALLSASVSAFMQPAGQTVPATAAKAAKEDLVAFAAANKTPFSGFWDPLSLADSSFWSLSNEATIGYLRHSEIKHGRIAMAGFLGFCAQSTPLVRGPHSILPYKGYIPDVTPQEQWDNIPYAGKLQIFCLIGMLESYGEGAGYLSVAGDAEASTGYTHYTQGGKPGYFPPIKGKSFGQIKFNLFDPLGWFPAKTEEQLEKGRISEINNGRLAMIGLMGLLSESSIPGSVPFLAGVPGFPRYAGEVMAPFSGDFSLTTIPAYTYFH